MYPCPTQKPWNAPLFPARAKSLRPSKRLYPPPSCADKDANNCVHTGHGIGENIQMKKVEMPKMGDSMEEGKILRWIKKEGDPVKKGESLAEVETDKVNIEIEAFASGLLRKIVVPEGSSALVGAEIALIGAADEPLPGNFGGNGGNGGNGG